MAAASPHQTFYWYGENHRLGSGNKTGSQSIVHRLLHWKNEGVVLPDSLPERFATGVAERPGDLQSAHQQYVIGCT
jgi:hypothetical protein